MNITPTFSKKKFSLDNDGVHLNTMTTNAPTPPPPVHTNPKSFETAYLFTGLVWTLGLKHLCRAVSKSSLDVIFRVITLTNKLAGYT